MAYKDPPVHTRWKSGQSGNPKGRPKKLPDIDKLIYKAMSEKKDKVSAIEAVIKALRAKAVKGDIRAIEILLDRYYGKVKQSIDLDGEVSFNKKIDLSNLTDEQLRQLAHLQSAIGVGEKKSS